MIFENKNLLRHTSVGIQVKCIEEKEEWWNKQWEYMTALGIEPGHPATLVRSLTNELPRSIPTIAATTTQALPCNYSNLCYIMQRN